MEYIQLLPSALPGDGALHNWVEAGADDDLRQQVGKRFVREDARRDDLTNALFEQPDSLMYVVVDSKVLHLAQGQNNWGQTVMSWSSKAMPSRPTPSKSWRNRYVPAGRSVETVNNLQLLLRYRRRQRVRQGANEGRIDTPPFYASRVPTVHHTMGGIMINAEAQVIGIDGEVIPAFTQPAR